MDKLRQGQLILIGIISFFVLFSGITLAMLLNKSYMIIGPEGFFAWGVGFLFFSGLLFSLVFTSRKFRVLFSLSLFLISGGIPAFLFLFQSYTSLEVIFVFILCGLLIISLILFFVFEGHNLMILVLCYLIGISGFMIFFSLFFNRPFFLMILQFIILLPFSFLSLKSSLQTYGSSHPIKIQSIYLKVALIITPIISAGIFLFPTKQIEIDPINSPEIIFWSSTSSLPTDEPILQTCYENDIGFCVVLRDYGRYLSNSARRHIEYLLNHSIITYICLGGPDGSFYCTVDSAGEFVEIFENIRFWLITNNLYTYPSFRGFVVDAETPREMIEDFGDFSFTEKCQYLIDHLPTRRELEHAEEDLDELINLIHDDEKEVGIIKLPSFFDELDFDSDYSTLSRNIYGLDIDPDFSVSMIYRTQHMPGMFDYMIQDMDQYSYASTDYELEYLKESELERSIIPISTFYYKVAYELNSKEFNVDKEDRYIFIGNFNSKFKHTSYIQDKEYKKDLDICRHFGVKQVWFYEWHTWKRYHSLSGLIKHNEDLHDEWYLSVPVYQFNRELFFSYCAALADRFLYVY